ncbi:MAG: hypothetical protein WED05_05465 [Candidatus Atabeyarchaeum deiterrae]
MAGELGWVEFLIQVLVLFIVLWLATRIVAGARKSSDKLLMILLTALVTIPIVYALGYVASIFYLGGLLAIIAYTAIIVLAHVLIDIAWDKSIIIAFIAEIVLYILHLVLAGSSIGWALPLA